ncbi:MULTISPECIES: hypothetical protein [unclassified Fibrobacter]|uniref:hypothetical protein n=1 Tax=unclassified Fibrobacter TaxID=2634177 RepID=UPI000916BDF0|nr:MULTISPECIES: hypothetical protein [unclassified Fibrobacter]OWV00517.1 hypothetical protein B7993_16085 [Fibrobacter sp. UWH3]SHL58867.1 hypothetical protein SAMN05720765_1186 [Fibrobacter sp. UWH6]
MRYLLSVLLITSSIIWAAKEECFELTSDSSITIAAGSWSDCEKRCSKNNGFEKGYACFWGYDKTNQEHLEEWYHKFIPADERKHYSLKDYKNNFCETLTSSIDSVFQNDDLEYVKGALNKPLAKFSFWSKYRDFIFFCDARNFNRVDSKIKMGGITPSQFADTLLGFSPGRSKLFSKEEWTKEDFFWSFILSNKQPYFESLGKNIDKEYNRIEKEQSNWLKKNKSKSTEFYLNVVPKKHFISNEDSVNDLKYDDYVSYLVKLKDEMKSLSPKWMPLIDRELQIHQQMSADCYCLLKEYEGDSLCRRQERNMVPYEAWINTFESRLRSGSDYFKKNCSVLDVTEKIASTISASLEDYYWVSARNHNQVKSYLINYPEGKYKTEAEDLLKANRVPIPKLVKQVNEMYEDGESLNKIIGLIDKYQDDYDEKYNETLNKQKDVFSGLRDTLQTLMEKWKINVKRNEYIESGCSFRTKKGAYDVEKDDLSKLPEKNGALTCYYPLLQYTGETVRVYGDDQDAEDVFAVVKLDANIVDRKIKNGIAKGFGLELGKVYEDVITNGLHKGVIHLDYAVDVMFDEKGYSIKFLLEDNENELDNVQIRNMFYILNSNKKKIKYLFPDKILASDEDLAFKAKVTKNQVKEVYFYTGNQNVSIPLNNLGEINGKIKYWDSDIGNVEIFVDANKPILDGSANSKITQVKIKGCTFNPPRKIVSYKKVKKDKIPVYEKYSKQCESIADEMGMDVLLTPWNQNAYYYHQAFIPDFLYIYVE